MMVETYKLSLLLIFSLALLVFLLLFFTAAPYGKFLRKGWGPVIKSKWAWMIMESPSPALMIILFFSSAEFNLPGIIFLLFWLMHYLHRTLIYPFSQPGRNKLYPFVLVLMALFFNLLNGFVNGYGLFHLKTYGNEWFLSWQFITGTLVFLSGFIINKIADEKFRRLRLNHPEEYVIPQGWLFRYVSCPHFLGEIIEWSGWALLTWSAGGLAFAVFTFANLFPRAISTHKWYKANFKEYPVNRKAVIPFVI